MNNICSILFIVILFTDCAIDRTILDINPKEFEILEEFKNLKPENQVQISHEAELGQTLWLCLSFISKESQKTLINQEIELYHTSAAGTYEPSDLNDESTARLHGSVITNNKGQVFVQTILPGDYGSSADNRHIHTTVKGAHPEAYDINFKQYTGMMGVNFISGSDQHFLADLKQFQDSILVAFLTIEVKKPQKKDKLIAQQIPKCEWCGAQEAPENIGWEATIADEHVIGERLILEGTIYETDGKTPAENVIVYAYHTNNEGLYEKKGNETGNGVRHGYLRAWAKTNREGKYRFYTIKPAPYPNRREPAHVHLTLMGPNFDEYWIDSTMFKDDKIITNHMVENLTRTGGFSNIIELKKNDDGIWVGERDIIINPPKE